MPPPLLVFISLLSLLSLSSSQQAPPLRGTIINCGSSVPAKINGRRWLPDGDFVTSGTSKNLTIPVLVPTLSTVRSFPLLNNIGRKFCYSVPVFRGARYLVRSTYFYGGANGNGTLPPVFDQIVDGTLWSVVNTTEDYANGMYSYYEGVFLAQGNRMSFCVGANTYTESDPFVSTLEFLILGSSLYNSTDFNQFGLALVARHCFGHNGRIRYPDDHFDRIWESLGEDNRTLSTNRNLSVSGIWNLPPKKLFEGELTTAVVDHLELKWPPTPLPKSDYYIALYFADDGGSSSGESRVVDVSINGVPYFQNLNVTPAGAVVFSKRWPLDGYTTVTLTSAAGSSAGPLINAGEVFNLLPLGGRTLTRDVVALQQLKSSFRNAPIDWNGDPCMPSQYRWTGITCSGGPHIRVVTLNLTSMGLLGSLSPNISRLTALTDIWLGSNNLSGPIPDLSSLKMLQKLHLEDNRFSGGFPSALANLKGLSELFLQNNDLTGQIPKGLMTKLGPNLRTSPGNQLLAPTIFLKK